MTLLSGSELDPKKFFRVGSPVAQASSFDLTVGRIYDHDGKVVEGQFNLKPGEMVQVVSAEIFNLGADVTGHVTYKTTLTRKGIWALTVGIVDPGWKSPVSTTLLNFSKDEFSVQPGEAFLRVSFFKHGSVIKKKLRPGPDLHKYYQEAQSYAATKFPPTFLNQIEIAQSAGKLVLERIRSEALPWIALITILFGLIQLVARYLPPLPEELSFQTDSTKAEISRMEAEIREMKTIVENVRAQLSSKPQINATPPAAPVE